jgi:hypothetical protein
LIQLTQTLLFRASHDDSKVRGRFTEFSGTVNFDEETPTNTSVHVEIDAASIDTQEEDRDNHSAVRPISWTSKIIPKLIFVGQARGANQ